MAKVLSAAQKDELRALLKLRKPTRAQLARIEELAPGVCEGCNQVELEKSEDKKS